MNKLIALEVGDSDSRRISRESSRAGGGGGGVWLCDDGEHDFGARARAMLSSAFFGTCFFGFPGHVNGLVVEH
jgi:hypothetical protein